MGRHHGVRAQFVRDFVGAEEFRIHLGVPAPPLPGGRGTLRHRTSVGKETYRPTLNYSDLTRSVIGHWTLL